MITPLTDRCYVTLPRALGTCPGRRPRGTRGYGQDGDHQGSRQGPRHAVRGVQLLRRLDYKAMGKIFSGLAVRRVGCFDEFNRINLEVLSVVRAAGDCHPELSAEAKTEFIFEGSEISLDDRGVFITMNPGYAGRSELPDNLKALFRPCAMMVPDYALDRRDRCSSPRVQDARPLAQEDDASCTSSAPSSSPRRTTTTTACARVKSARHRAGH